MAKLGEKPRKFLDESPYVGVVTTLREDGSPHSTIVWVDVEGDRVAFNTARGRLKPKNLERDGRASLVMVDPGDPYRWVSVSGPAEMTEDGADAQIDKLAKKYIGKDQYPWRNPEEKRVKVLIEPDKITASGLDE
jgi:PPOX class probable F420-dependent enzyme